MKSFDDRKLAKSAASAAMLGIPMEGARDAYVIERLGAKDLPPIVPPPPDCTDDQKAIKVVEQRLTAGLPPLFLYAALACLFGVEVIGLTILMASLGAENPARMLLAIMFAATIFLLTYVAARLGATPTGGAAGAPHTQRMFYGVLAVYAVIVFAIAIIRMNEMRSNEDGSRIYDFAAAIIMICTTIGPAWLAEVLMQRLLPMIPLIRTQALHRRYITDAQRGHTRAIAGAKAATLRAEAWRRDAEQLGAMYETRYNNVLGAITQAKEGAP